MSNDEGTKELAQRFRSTVLRGPTHKKAADLLYSSLLVQYLPFSPAIGTDVNRLGQ